MVQDGLILDPRGRYGQICIKFYCACAQNRLLLCDVYKKNNGVQGGLIVDLRYKFLQNRFIFERDMAKYVFSFTAHAHKIGSWFPMSTQNNGVQGVLIVNLHFKFGDNLYIFGEDMAKYVLN